MKYKSSSFEETLGIGQQLAKRFKPGDIVFLRGDLGYGKTTFAKGVAKALGVKTIVNSPTFTIIREHEATNGTFYHIDLFRIENKSQLKEIGVEEKLSDPSSIKLIEWPDLIEDIVEKRIEIVFKLGEGENERTINVYE